MVRRTSLLWIGLLPLLLMATAFAALAVASPATQGDEVSSCDTGRQKWASPTVLYVGEEAEVTSVITGTCPAYDLPIDMILLVDQSNSMTKGDPGDFVPGTGTPDDSGLPTRPPRPTDPTLPTEDPEPEPTGFAAGGRDQPRGVAQLPTLTPRPPRPTDDGVVPTDDDIIHRGREEPPGTEDLIREVSMAIRDFLDEVQDDVKDGKVRIGLASFDDRGHELMSLTDNVSKVTGRLSRIRGGGNTRVDLGLSTATRMLVGVGMRGRTDMDHRKLIVVFSDGKFDRRITARLRTRDGLDVITVAAGRSADQAALRRIATESEYAVEMRDRKELVQVYRRIAPRQRQVTMDTLTIEDVLAANMDLVPGSANPVPARVLDGRNLQWDFAPPAFPITLTYRVKPQEVGLHPVSELAHAMWADSEGRKGDVPIPEVELEVLQLPTPTPTPTSTPTATGMPTNTPEPTPTPVPPDLYLPIVMKSYGACVPSQQTVDVAMIVDTSMSMGEPTRTGGVVKLDAAIDAMKQLVEMLKDDDQAAVVEFNADASVVVQLTRDHVAARAALDGLPAYQNPGTRIDLGLTTALAELQSPRIDPNSNQAIVLVTDGRQDELVGRQAVLDAAAAIKAADIEVFAVGVGSDVDGDLLRQVASSDDTLFLAPNAEDLANIYRRIAEVITCPQGRP